MLTQTLKALFRRDLEQLKREIELYQSEEKIWYTEKGISNSAGNLCLHLVGNLNAFIGAELGKTGYVRHRDLEFSLKNVSRSELLTKIDETNAVVERALENLTIEQLEAEYPQQVFGKPMTTEYLLVHLSSHLMYHLGQINYHRRLLDA
ncbi:DinB family protein [Spirosoma spitsbergense]|uniref:DinB family protein n=1 Tax=Spirosoma spitsbergense TaxID=431554 RepID=UPI00037EBDA1|nr:DinB family protein [Spirosoma spitsbergense]